MKLGHVREEIHPKGSFRAPTTQKSKVGSEQRAIWEETPPSQQRIGFFKREELPAAEGPPPSLIFAREAFVTRSTFESQHWSEKIAQEAISILQAGFCVFQRVCGE